MRTSHNDKFKFLQQRKYLIDSLRRRGNLDNAVLDAMLELPREIFLGSAFQLRSYEDTALPIDCNQTISQPYTVAYMTGELKIKKDDKILEIGTGSGYQACLLYLLGARVFTVERITELFEKSNLLFKELGMSINTRIGDGSLGWREFAPFDGIIVTAAAPKPPKSLMEQLAIGGRLVIPIGDKWSQTMYTIVREGENKYFEDKTDRFKFVPLIGKEGWDKE